ncbi:hypothetical protein DFH08DRAFT_877126 [Mycena albidolilacea]|uniref:DUF6534 domain-containing protein n=1 Tax=Mycena albidolilacea TaxID=1033008 RepID=A0AAD6ZU25_9AGAR|nr:hypothetical protein DFH08DRAFT_877126 [Mycena albidolilacea]
MSAPEGLGSVIDDAIQSVKELSAAAFIGYGLSTAAYGISIVQVYLYFRNYPKDSIFLKLTMSISDWAPYRTLDTLSSIVTSHALYTLYTTINTTSLIFYGWQIWSVSRNFVVVDLSVHLFLFPTIVSLFGHTSRSMTTTIESTGLVCDITITTSLIYYLRSRKTAGYICRLLMTYQDVAYPNHFYWQPFYQLLGKLYVNSILASLNARTSVRGKGQLEVSTRSALRAMEFASGSGSTPHSDSKIANSCAGSGQKEFQVQVGMMDSMHSESNRDVGIKSFPQIPPLCLDSSTINIS